MKKKTKMSPENDQRRQRCKQHFSTSILRDNKACL